MLGENSVRPSFEFYKGSKGVSKMKDKFEVIEAMKTLQLRLKNLEAEQILIANALSELEAELHMIEEIEF